MKRHTQLREEKSQLKTDQLREEPVTFFVTRLPDAIAKGARFESRRSYAITHRKVTPTK